MSTPIPSQTPPDRWVGVGKASDWPEEGARTVEVGARRIGVYRHGGGWYALKDICPHAGISLVYGQVEAGMVTCPGHGWAFRLATGEMVNTPGGSYRIATYPIRVQDGTVEIGV